MAAKFSFSFVAIVATLSATTLVDEIVFNGAIAWALCSGSATIVAATMRGLTVDVVATGNQIRYGTFSCYVVPECTGIDFMGLFVAAVCAFPCAWESKIRCLAVGLPTLLALNIFRIAGLVAVGAHWPEALRISHLYVAPLGILTVTLWLWFTWVDKTVADVPII